MPEFAQFIVLPGTDDAFEAKGRLFTFDLPDLDTERTVVLMFKVSGPNGARLKMALTSAGQTVPIRFDLDSSFTRPRSWHEVVGKDSFAATGNRLVVESDQGSSGFAKVSDIVVLYHAKTP